MSELGAGEARPMARIFLGDMDERGSCSSENGGWYSNWWSGFLVVRSERYSIILCLEKCKDKVSSVYVHFGC